MEVATLHGNDIRFLSRDHVFAISVPEDFQLQHQLNDLFGSPSSLSKFHCYSISLPVFHRQASAIIANLTLLS